MINLEDLFYSYEDWFNFKKGKMKKRFIKILCSLSLLLCVSCIGTWEREVNLGFPETITFTCDGGERVYKGNESKISVSLYNPEPVENLDEIFYGFSEETGVHYEVNCWLRVEFRGLLVDSLKLYAEPNLTGKPRQMELTINSGNIDYQTIDVIQEG